MDEPPLVANLERRRTSALAVLRNATGCAAGQIGVTSEKPCATCQDRRAMRVVSDGMNILMTRYVQAAQAALDGAFANPDRHGPRLVAYEVEGRGTVETIDSKHVSVVGRLDQGTAVALVTCYRDRSRSLQSWWLEHARLRAAHRRAGTLLTLG